MRFTDRYKSNTRRTAEPGGNIVVESKSIEYNDGNGAVMTGTVVSGQGKGQNVTLRLPESDAKVIKKGLMKHAQPEGGMFHFTGVENKAGKNYRHLTLFAADPANPGDNSIFTEHMVRPRIRLSRTDKQPVSISHQTFDPAAGQPVDAAFAAVKEAFAKIVKDQIANGRAEDGVGYLVYNADTKDTDFRTVTRRNVQNEAGDYVSETEEQLVDRFAQEFLGTEKAPTEEEIAGADEALSGYTVKMFPVTTYPVVGDTRAVEIEDLKTLLEGGNAFTKLSTQIFRQASLAARIDYTLSSAAIPDTAKTMFIDNFKKQASAVALAAYDQNKKFADLPDQDFRDFVNNVLANDDMSWPQRNDGYGYGWARACFVVGGEEGKQPIMKIMAPTVNRGNPLPQMEETRDKNSEIYTWPKDFITKGASWDPQSVKEKDTSKPDNTPAGQGDYDISPDDMNDVPDDEMDKNDLAGD